jgi:hypothetical protein
MRKILTLLVVAAVTVLPHAARAQCGDTGASTTDYMCTNACPLAKKASTRRATGLESALTSATVRDAVATNVAAKLKKF